MTTIAKFPGRCSVCGGSIQRGEQVEWAKGEGVRHPADSECDRAAAKAARKAARKHAHREATMATIAAAGEEN